MDRRGEEIDVSDAEIDEAETVSKKVAGITAITSGLLEDSASDTAQRVGTGQARDIAHKIDAAFFAATAPTNGPNGLGSIDFSSVIAGTIQMDQCRPVCRGSL